MTAPLLKLYNCSIEIYITAPLVKIQMNVPLADYAQFFQFLQFLYQVDVIVPLVK